MGGASSPDPNNCADFEAQLLPDRMGQSDLESPELRHHLSACRSCRETLEAREGLARELARAPRLAPQSRVAAESGRLESFRSVLAAVEERQERAEEHWAPVLRDQPRISAPAALWPRILASLRSRPEEASSASPGPERSARWILRLRPVASVAAALVVVGSVVAVVQLARPDHDRPGGFTGAFGEALVSSGVRVEVRQLGGPSGLTLPTVGDWRPMATEDGT